MTDYQPVIRKMDTLDPIFQGIAKEVQSEYDYWIAREREMRDGLAEAVEQVRIRERLLGELRELL